MSGERLIYLPLGGAGEIGMNAYVYGYGLPGKERLMLVDLGVAFPDMDTSPGVDLIVPDLSWLIDNLDRLDGIIITHAHEDHIGAIAWLWPKLRAPIYATPFTAYLVNEKLRERGLRALLQLALEFCHMGHTTSAQPQLGLHDRQQGDQHDRDEAVAHGVQRRL